jgi:nucleotide-binding universal stress UspA family protein
VTERPLILHPTDLGPASQPAFRHALRIALALKASLRLIHVHRRAHEDTAPVDAFPHVRETLVRWGMLAPGAPPSALAEQLDLHVSKAEAVAAHPEAALEELVAKAAPDLIVLGTHGRDGIDAFRHGSVAETLTRRVRMPALIVPGAVEGFVREADGAASVASVLAPVVSSPDPMPAVVLASRFLRAFGAEPRISLLHVGPGGGAASDRAAQPGHYGVMFRAGPVVDAIVDATGETAADLIVMTSEGHDSLADALHGSTTEQVLRRAGRPLLVVPAQ